MPTISAIQEILEVHLKYVAKLRAIQDTWELLTTLDFDQVLDHGSGAKKFAMKFYPQFIAMLVHELPADQDVMLHVARGVFSVNIPTMRADLKLVKARIEVPA